MFRGTTPTLVFTLPIEANTITALNIAIAQYGRVVISRGLKDIEKDGKVVRFTLSEDETLRLNANTDCQIQLRCGVGNARMASQIFTIPVEKILQEGVLDGL